MESIKFSSLNDLYNRLLPALNTKKSELKAAGVDYVMPEDIWNFLKQTKWPKYSGLTLHDMVNDIMMVDSHDMEYYLKKKMRGVKRELDPDTTEESIL